jgi:hypothetical protein
MVSVLLVTWTLLTLSSKCVAVAPSTVTVSDVASLVRTTSMPLKASGAGATFVEASVVVGAGAGAVSPTGAVSAAGAVVSAGGASVAGAADVSELVAVAESAGVASVADVAASVLDAASLGSAVVSVVAEVPAAVDESALGAAVSSAGVTTDSAGGSLGADATGVLSVVVESEESTSPCSCAVAATVGAASVAVVAVSAGAAVVSTLRVAALSNPVGSPPTFEDTGVDVSAGADDCDVAADEADGPYRFVTTAAGAIQFRRAAIAPVCTIRVAVCVLAALRCCAWKNCVGADVRAACAAGATFVFSTGKRSVGTVNASSA